MTAPVQSRHEVVTPSISDLAIVLPAYRARFLTSALRSIAAQTDQRFHLYVFDNGSRENLRSIYEEVFPHDQPNVTFRRFDDNLGASALVHQWNRCVNETGNEPWVWLFADDDIAEPGCVAAFHRHHDSNPTNPVNVFRFNTLTINSDGLIVRINPPHPAYESSLEFIYHRLMHARLSYAPEYLFRRSTFEANEGFIDFPFALGSDDASWIAFSGEHPIALLSGQSARVLWRQSEFNTSRLMGRDAVEKLCAAADYAGWLWRWLDGRTFVTSPSAGPMQVTPFEIMSKWYLGYIHSVTSRLTNGDITVVADCLARNLPAPASFWNRSLGSARRRQRFAAVARNFRRLVPL